MLRGVVLRRVAGRTRPCLAGRALRASALRLSRPFASRVGAPRSGAAPAAARLHTSAPARAGAPAGPTPTSGVIPFVLADIGEGIAECEVMKWFVGVGDAVKEFDKVCLVQSDKATVEITSRYEGVVKKLHYAKGAMAQVGSPLIDIDLGGGSAGSGAASAAPAAGAAASPSASTAAAAAAPSASAAAAFDGEDGPGKPQASPAVRRIARENGVDLSLVTPSGPKGRILKEDVQAFVSRGGAAAAAPVAPVAAPVAAAPVAAAAAAAPAAAAKASAPFPTGLAAAPAQDTVQSISGLARIMVQTMTASNAVPQFGYCDEVGMDALMALRDSLKKTPPPPSPTGASNHVAGKDGGVRISYLPFLLKATSLALRAYPQLNAHVNPGCTELTVKAQHNLGLAMDTPRGLLVPNIKNVQQLSVWQIAAELHRLQALGRAGMLGAADLKGATFTLSNIGTIGGTYAKPLVVVPEIVIGALGRIQTLPRYNAQGQVVPHNLMVVSWSADHRVVDGATMARFGNLWKYYVEHPAAMLLDTK